MPIKYAFQHQVGTWFLHIEARTLKDSGSPCLSNFAAIEVGDKKCDGNRLTGSLQNTREGATILRGRKKSNISVYLDDENERQVVESQVLIP